MAAATLRDFLVSVGYSVDATSEKRLLDGLAVTAAKIFALSAAAAVAKATVTASLSKMAEAMEELYYSSQRTGAAVESIQALGYAAGQTGSSAASAKASLEALGRFMRSNPGAGGFLQSMGLRPDQIHDAGSAMRGLAQQFRQMPEYMAIARGGTLGIDYNTILAMRNGEIERYEAEFGRFARAVGLDSNKAAASAHGFMVALRSVGAAVDVLLQKFTASLTPRLTVDIERFRNMLVSHMGDIVAIMERAAHFVLNVADGIAVLVVRAVELNDQTGGLITTFAALLTAWKVLSAGILMSPLGLMIAAISGILMLFDDYRTWKEGGVSAIDWSKWDKTIQGMFSGLEKVATTINDAIKNTIGWQSTFAGLALFVATNWVTSMLGSIGKVSESLLGVTGRFSVLARLAGLGGLIYGLWPGSTQTQEQENVGLGRPPNAGPMYHADGRADHGWSSEVVKFFTGRGWSLAQASGIAANLEAESSYDPNRPGDGGAAYGIAQWHPDRQAAIAARFGKRVQDMGFEEQLEAVNWELRHGAASEQRAGMMLGATDEAGAAGSIVSYGYERPKDQEGAAVSRAARAREIFKEFQSTALAPNAAGSGNVTLNQQTEITVHGATDPHATASAVGQEVDRANRQVQRNMQGGAAR